MKTFQRGSLAATGALLTVLATNGCGGDSDDPSEPNEDGGSIDGGSTDASVDAASDRDASDPRDGESQDAGGSDAGGSDSGGSDSGGGSLFDDTPNCTPTGAGSAKVKIEGTLGTFTVAYEQSPVTSDLRVGSLDTVTFEGMTQIRPLNLRWQGGLQPGEIHALTGNSLVLADEFTGGAGPHCVLAGEIASTTPDRKPTMGALVHFRITKVQKRTARDNTGTCEGPELAADLTGCLYRTNDYLPPN